MKRLIKNGALFGFIIFAFYAFPTTILILSGELKPLQSICEEMEVFDDKLFGLAYSDITQVYKLEETRRRVPKVLALGTSRIMQISSAWFSTSFYNAGGGIVEPIDIIPFLDKLDTKPELLIVNFDQFFFNEKAANRFNADYRYKYEPFELIRTKAVRVYLDFIKGKITIGDLANNDIGLNACVNKNGFKSNGCYYYGGIINNPKDQPDYLFMDCIDRIDKGDRRFEYNNEIDENTVSDIQQVVSYCHNNNIKLIALIPPFAPTVQSYLSQKTNSYLYMNQIYDSISHLFNNKDSFLYDYQFKCQTDSPDEEFIDGFHGSEATYLHMWLKIIESCPIAQKYSYSNDTLSKLLETKEYNINYHK